LLSSLLVAADYRFVKIDFPDASATAASGINARGNIVGRYDDANGVVHGFLLRKGVFISIDCCFMRVASSAPRRSDELD
jgi:probable HAF family extracellular repeat protein